MPGLTASPSLQRARFHLKRWFPRAVRLFNLGLDLLLRLLIHVRGQAARVRSRFGPARRAAAEIRARHGLRGFAEILAARALVKCQKRPPLCRAYLVGALRREKSATGRVGRLRERVRGLPAWLGIRMLDARFDRAYRRLLADPRVPLLPKPAFREERLLTMIGSLGPGGAERQLVTLLRGLAGRGYSELELIGLFLDIEVNNFFRPQLDESRVRVAEMRREADAVGALAADFPDQPAAAELVDFHSLLLPGELVEIWHYLREMLTRRPGVFHGWMDDVNVKGGIAAAIAGVPRIVLSTRSVAPDNFELFQPFMRSAYRVLMGLPQVTVLNNSEAGARDYERWLGVPTGSIHVVRNGFDFAPFDRVNRARTRQHYRSRLGVPIRACVVGTIIRFTEEKQPFLWLEAAARVARKHPDTRFLMLGDGPLREPVAARGRELGLGERLLLPGYESDTIAALAAMDVFMLTSRVEGLPNVLIEAQAMGVPVVAPRAGGVPETFRAGEGGWLVTNPDAESFARAASEAVSDPVALAAMGRRARSAVRQSFQIQRMVSGTLGHYSWPAPPQQDSNRPRDRAGHHGASVPFSARCQSALAGYRAAFPDSPPVTVIVDIGRRPYLRQAWLPLLEEPLVASLLVVHARTSDEGYVQNEREGFVSYVTGASRLPARLGEGALSLSGRTTFEPWLLNQLSATASSPPVAFVAFQGTASGWERASALEMRMMPARRNPTVSPQGIDGGHGDRRQRLAGSRYFPRFWPPHTCAGEGVTKGSRARLQALAALYAEELERQDGTPFEPALTTRPLLSARGDAGGPVVVACMSLKAGGAERQAALTARGIHERGWPTVFLAYDEQDDVASDHYASVIRGAGIPLLNAAREAPYPGLDDEPPSDEAELETRLALDDRCDALRMGIAPMLRRYLAVFMRLRPRVVHTWLDYTNAVAGLAALWAGVPRLVLGLRNVGPMRLPLYQPFFRPLYRLLIQDARTLLVANSRAGARDYAAWLGIDVDRIRIVPNAFEPTLHQLDVAGAAGDPARLGSGALVLGVFRFYFEKDPLLFVRAAAEIAREMPETRFRLVGSGPLEAEVRGEADRLGLRGRLEFAGLRGDVLAWMREASLLLHTARVEGLPNVLIEAQAAGLPVVATRAGGSSEAIDPGVTGVVLDSREPRDLAREAVRLLRSPEWLAKARESGPAFVRRRFGLETMLARTSAVYGLPNSPSASEGHPMGPDDRAVPPSPLVWTPELVARFWDGLARAGLDDVMAFGGMAKRCILWLVGRHLVAGGRHLDYGSGGGEVAGHLIEHGFPFAVFEPSAERQRGTEARLASLAGFLGSPGADSDGFDAVTCFEVLEHVLDEHFEGVCDEIARYVRPGGKLILSTPNNEDLARDTVYCPTNNQTFHRWQHVRRVTGDQLEQTFARRGFRKLCLHQLDFDENLFRPYLHLMGLLAPGADSIPARRPDEIVPLHIHQVLHDIDGVMGGASRLLYVGTKDQAAS